MPDGRWTLADADGTTTGQTNATGTAEFAQWFRAAVQTVDLGGGGRCAPDVAHIYILVEYVHQGEGAEPPDPMAVDTSSCRDVWSDGFAADLADRWEQASLPAPEVITP